ncbi:LysR family transcriptional regulator [Paenibacillus flagellatus]|uniref:LysR family transcriptional regulator n=1 Tax=Paenibacillus flagellatus TaxID=2211139 RepID=A0A2V5JZX7_9BACL|nr:LysR family transcriptional regulator [Paenibacillus flagellatus]PYI52515.1 LysR family transcriptional regulator [Paenibacillus flagellatus]
MDQALIVFIAVAEKKHFTRAAEELHMTQPAVSQYIRALERTVGTRLLERDRKQVRLNKAGEIVYRHAKEIVGLYGRMQSLVDDLLHQASGRLAIGASYTFGEYALPRIIARLQSLYPSVKPAISIGNTKDISEAVAAGELDIGVVEGEFPHERLRIEPFAEDRMHVVAMAGHRLAQTERGRLGIDELADETWIVRESGSGTRKATESMFARFGFEPRSRMEFGSTQLIKESVEAGLGVSLLSGWAIRKELALGTLRVLDVAGTPVSRQFYVVIPAADFHTRATEVFRELLLREGAHP